MQCATQFWETQEILTWLCLTSHLHYRQLLAGGHVKKIAARGHSDGARQFQLIVQKFKIWGFSEQ